MQQWHKCPICGAQVAFGVRFCGNCGAQLNWPPQQQWDYAQGQQGPQQKKTSPWLIGFIALIAIVVLVGGATFVFKALSQNTPPVTPASGETPAPAANFTLTMYVHEGSTSGPVLSGVQVSGQDGVGSPFNQTTNSSGYVTVTGAPGTWQFGASKSGYQSNNWSLDITSTDTKHAYLAAELPPPTLPPGMGAIMGRLMWGDKPVVNGTVVADAKPPIIVWSPEEYKKFTTQTDEEGNYLLIVEPENYYLLCSLPESDYLSYEIFGVVLPVSNKVAAGEVIKKNLQALDWSIELISPGEPEYDTGKTIDVNPPTLRWKAYDWERYGEVGYYEVELGIYKDGLQIVLRDKTENTVYTVKNPLEQGKYRWQVRAYTKTGKEISGCREEFYFLIP
jgi:hypothetical protein